MNEEQTLELKMQATAQQCTKTLDKLINSLTRIDKNVSSINNTLITTNSKTNTTKKNIDNVRNSIDKATNSANKFTKAFNLASVFYGTKRLTNQLLNWLDLAVDRTEQLNLFNVVFKNIEKNGTKTFSTLGKEAIQFQNKLNETFGTNLTETLKYQGLFQSMGENVGIPTKYASIMSETMTKLTYDLASLYNKSESVTGEALRAGVYAGQTKPLRSFGIDVTQQSMQPILDEIGITDRSVKQMSQAEKEILRYIATLRQAQIAMGDFANTIESPANQMKIMKQQLIEAKVALTSLFIGTFSEVLPYINAFLMVTKEIAEALADMFGIKLSDYNNGIADQEDAYIDLEESIGGATDAVKELKRQTLGFDQINNINENNDNGLSGGELVGGIDQRLLDAINGYDNGMNRVRMKAAEIRDRIMEWLGFTKEIDPLTGEVGFKLKEGETRFSKIAEIAKFIWDNALTALKIIVGYKIVKGLTNILETLTNIKDVWGDLGLTPKILLSVGLVVGAVEFSKTDFYQDYVESRIGKRFENGLPDMLKEWYESYFDVHVDIPLELRERELKDIFKAFELLELGLSTGNEEYTRIANETLYKYHKIYDIDQLAAFYQQNKDVLKAIENSKALFNNSKVSIEDYVSIFKEYLNEMTSKIPNINEFNNVIEQNGIAYSNANIELEHLIDQLVSTDLTNSERTFSNITSCLDTMTASVEASGKAFTESITTTINHLRDEGRISEETANKVIASAVAKENAEKMAVQEYASALESLNKELQDGIITREQYSAKVAELNANFSKASASVSNYQNKLSNLGSVMHVNYGNYDTMKKIVGEIGTTYEETSKACETSYNTQIEQLYKLLESVDPNTEEYNEILNSISATYGLMEDSVKEMRQTTANEFLKIVADLTNSGALATNEGKEIANKINEEFRRIGVEVDVTQGTEHIKTQLSNAGIDTKAYDVGIEAGKKFNSGVSTTGTTPIELQVNTANAERQVINWWNGIKSIISATFNMDLNIAQGALAVGRANGGLYNNGKWHNITQYANGGLPSTGQMFIAREAGPELVGKIGSSTAVMNNMQIVDSVKTGVYEAVSMAMSQYGGGNVDVHLHTDEGIVIDRINQQTRQTGVFPLTIPTI